MELVTREFELVTHGFDLVTRAFELVTRGFEIVTPRFELVTSNSCLLLHTQNVHIRKSVAKIRTEFLWLEKINCLHLGIFID